MEIRFYRDARDPDLQFEIRLYLEESDIHFRDEIELNKLMELLTGLVEAGYPIKQACWMLQSALASRADR